MERLLDSLISVCWTVCHKDAIRHIVISLQCFHNSSLANFSKTGSLMRFLGFDHPLINSSLTEFCLCDIFIVPDMSIINEPCNFTTGMKYNYIYSTLCVPILNI